MSIPIGKQISHYRILEKLGEGGMGMVYKAEDLKLKRPVAIKFLPPFLTKDQEARIRFSQEAEAASALDHPNICTIYEIDQTDDGQIFMVMAYYEGETLSNKITRSPLSLKESLNITIQIADGLAKAHKHGIVHRDVKPANIIISDDGVVKILDFGLAKLAGQTSLTKEHTSIGTVNYMSPEQAQGNVVDDRTDIWSLGVLLYETITGRFPFKGEYEQAVIYSIINLEPEPLEKIRQDVPKSIRAVIKKSLSKKPGARYQTVLELIEDLQNAQESIKTISSAKINVPKVKTGLNKIKIASMVIVVFILMIFLFKLLFIPSGPYQQKSLTVLPFENLNQGEREEYFSDGITEDIVIQLSKISELRVISYRSSVSYKNTEKNLRQVGEELNVDNILTGKVRREDSVIRITAQLIQASTGVQLWADTYDRNLSEVFNIQSEVAKKIASALEITLSSEEEKRIDKRYTKSLGAYDYYLNGRDYYNRLRKDDNEIAITLFKKACSIDRNFALAYAGLADAYVQKTLRFGSNSHWLDSAVVQCDQALAIDENLAEAHKALGLIHYTRSWFDKSLRENLTALELNPNFYIAMHNLGWISLNLGNLKEAKRWMEKALRVNPIFASTYLGFGMIYLNLGNYDKALHWLNSAYDIHPDLQPNPMIAAIMIDLINGDQIAAELKSKQFLSGISDNVGVYITAGDIALHSGNPIVAGEYYEKALVINPKAWHPFSGVNATTSLGFILWKTDHRIESDEMLDYSLKLDEESIAQGSEWWGIDYDMAAVFAIRGNTSECYQWLERAVKNGFRLYTWLRADPLFENMREDHGFQDLIRDLEKRVSTARADIIKNFD